MQIYVVNFSMDSGNKQLSSADQDEYTRMIHYRFGKKERAAINRLRGRYRQPALAKAVCFHGIYLCTDELVADLQEAAQRADAELKQIHPQLSARVHLVPIDVDQVHKGELYGEIMATIRSQIMNEVLSKIDTILEKGYAPGQLPPKTRKMMLNLVERLRLINIMRDEKLDAELDRIHQHIVDETYTELRESLSDDIETLQREIEVSQSPERVLML